MLFKLRRAPVELEEFVSFWSSRYVYSDLHLYDENVGRELSAERVFTLFRWKNGGRLTARQESTVQCSFVERSHELTSLPYDLTATAFLRIFSTGGAIWRIFWLHLWKPDRFPMYDQHVHRAMQIIQNVPIVELKSMTDRKKISHYVDDYLPFIRQYDGVDARKLDQALWALGKLMKPLRPNEIATETDA